MKQIKIFQADMYFSDVVDLTLERLKAKKYRTFLTILGVGIGIAVVYILVSLTFGLQKLVIGNITSSESLLSLDVLPNTEIRDVIKLTDTVLAEIKSMDGVSEISASKSLPAEIVYNDIKTQTLTYGADPRFFSLSNIKADKGELYKDGESQIVVSSAILSLFGIEEQTALGAKLRLSFIKPNIFFGDSLSGSANSTASAALLESSVVEIPEQLTIVGIISDDSNYIYLPLKYFDGLDQNEYRAAKVKAENQAKLNEIRDNVSSRGFMVSAMTDTLTQINNIFRVTQITFTVIGVIALIIASIGMINTMTVSLLERTREIGIMRTIGATSKDIQYMFLTESIIMGLGGGIGGLLLGFVVTNILSIIVKIFALAMGGQAVNIFYTPPWFYILVLVFSLAIGLITGIFPAKRAASLNPIDALRYE
jgi:putative ABC transport system permease protein